MNPNEIPTPRTDEEVVYFDYENTRGEVLQKEYVTFDFARTLERELHLANQQVEEQWIKGQWKCPKCSFVLSKAILCTGDGNVYANAEPFNEVCPNDSQLMKPLTYKESYKDLIAACESQVLRAVRAEEQITKLEATCGELKNWADELSKMDSCQCTDHYRCAKCQTIERWKNYRNTTTSGQRILEDNRTMMVALDKLAHLGNEPNFGNSKGNDIARRALDELNSTEALNLTNQITEGKE